MPGLPAEGFPSSVDNHAPPTEHRMNWTVGRREPRTSNLDPPSSALWAVIDTLLHLALMRPALIPAAAPCILCGLVRPPCGPSSVPPWKASAAAISCLHFLRQSVPACSRGPRQPLEACPAGLEEAAPTVHLSPPLCAGLCGLLPQRVVSVLPQRVEEVTLSRLSLGPPAVIVSSRDPSLLVQSSSQHRTRQSRQAAFGRP
jgi:hypothetical protein